VGRQRRRHGVEVVAVLADRDADHGISHVRPAQVVHDEALFRGQDLVAGFQERAAHVDDDLGGAVAQAQHLGTDLQFLAEFLAQVKPAVLRVVVQVVETPANGLHRPRRRAQRILVRGHLDHVVQVQLALDLRDGLARLVGFDGEDVGGNNIFQHGASTMYGMGPTHRSRSYCIKIFQNHENYFGRGRPFPAATGSDRRRLTSASVRGR